jgi:hypothetical protein
MSEKGYIYTIRQMSEAPLAFMFALKHLKTYCYLR